ncbi:MAG: DUF1302 domain-containing protein [Gammaproteobacteria bacterium]|nr:DUF1302 domain-containing protein [Gammaproteobacteria bacterium]
MYTRFVCGRAQVLLAGLIFILPLAAQAVTFRHGDLTGSFDTTIGYGVSVRAKDADLGNNNSYGNRNFDQWDITTNTLKASHELALQQGNFGLFGRGNYFYDFEMADQRLVTAAEDRAVQHGDITDFFVYGRFGDSQQLTLRLGKQVISWGESLFIGGSINDINTIDITKVRTPGVELKDAFVGSQAAYLQWSVTPVISFETFYLFSFDELKLDPSGSFFGTNDSIIDGGGFGPTPDGFSTALLGFLPRTGDNLPTSSGQWGAALHYYSELNGGTDFGFYYQNLHDHNPQLSTTPGSGTFFLDYAEDVERYAVSFNTQLGRLATFGEISYRRNAPMQLTDFVGVALGAPGTGTGFSRTGRGQAQAGFQSVYGPVYWAKSQGWDTLFEVAYGWNEDAPANSLFGATSDFWLYQFSTNLNYPSLFTVFNTAVNVKPKLAFKHSVRGTSGDQLFVDNAKSVTVGMDYDYRVSWKGSLTYTDNFGDGSSTDRDFIAFSLSYAF